MSKDLKMDTLADGLATRMEQLQDALEQSTWMARQRIADLERQLDHMTEAHKQVVESHNKIYTANGVLKTNYAVLQTDMQRMVSHEAELQNAQRRIAELEAQLSEHYKFHHSQIDQLGKIYQDASLQRDEWKNLALEVADRLGIDRPVSAAVKSPNVMLPMLATAISALNAENTRIVELERQLAELREQKPLFWYRPVCNGEMYEGPVHANSIGGKMLREEKPDEWLPLYASPVPPQPAGADAQDAARYRWLRRGQRYSVVNGIGDDLRAEALDAAVDADISYINSSNGAQP